MLAAALPVTYSGITDPKKSSRGLFLVHLSMFCILRPHGALRMSGIAPHGLAPSSESLSTGTLARNVLKIHQSKG
jgi:hypothetical protein